MTQSNQSGDDPRSVNELIEYALNEPDDDLAWDAAEELQRRGTAEVLAQMRELCKSEAAIDRQLGADVLGQLGAPTRSFPQETEEILHAMLEIERDEDVLRSILIALSHNEFVGTIDVALIFAEHFVGEVRQAAVLALSGSDEPRAIAKLIELTTESHDDVRNWATFAIGTQIDADTTAIREALAARLDDPDEDVRGEAMVGLARRKDHRALAAIRDELERSPNDFAVEAAGLTKAHEFVSTLISLRDSPILSSYALETAIVACSSRVFERN